MEINDKTRNIPSLDGMRAISILLVIVAHTSQNYLALDQDSSGLLSALRAHRRFGVLRH